VPGHAEQVPRARAFIAGALAACGLRDETACLLGSELVTNSVQHSNSRLPGGTITVTVAAAPAEILVEVTDGGGAGVPVLRDGADACAEDGRGLLVVAALSARWGYRRDRGKLTTWCQIPAEPERTTYPASVPSGRDRLPPPHSPEPTAGTFRTLDGQDADLFNLHHYPVRAICQVCGKQIKADTFLRPFWHVEDKLPSGETTIRSE
jgi:anti-sigma regulatory factor (Ser/Thr protein kinase)